MVPTTLLKVLKENPFLVDVATIYGNAGYEFYLVGGAVRDGILDIATSDFDFTTNATTDQSLKLLKENKNLNISSSTNNGVSIVHISD